MFKKRFKIFMCNLGKLFTFSFGFLGLFGLIALLGGWSQNNDSIIFENKFDFTINDLDYYDDIDFTLNTSTDSFNLTNNGFEKTRNNYKFDFSYDSNGYMIGNINSLHFNFDIYFNRTITIDSMDCFCALPYLIFTSNDNSNYYFDIRDSIYEFDLEVDMRINNHNNNDFLPLFDNLYHSSIINGNYCYSLQENVLYGNSSYTFDCLDFDVYLEFENYFLDSNFLCNQIYFCFDNVMLVNYDKLSINDVSNSSSYYNDSSSYADLLNQIEILENDISLLNDEKGVLEEQLSTLTDNYNDLYNSINVLESVYNGANAYLFNFDNNVSLYTYANQTNSYLAMDSDFQVPRSEHIAVSDFTNIYDFLDESENNGNSLIWSIRLTNITNMPLNINFVNNEVYSVYLVNTFTNELNSFDVINNSLSINNQQEYKYNVVLIKVYQKSWTWDTLSTNNYNLLYNQGYAQATYDLNIRINELNTIIYQKEAQIRDLTEQVSNQFGWKPFIFTMADTPFRVVSNVLGFEVLGVNLYKVLIGLITTLAILWLIRKLRK